LAGGIAHDFNNLLTGLLGNLEIAKMRLNEGHPAYSFLENAISVFERASDLSRQLLVFTKEDEPAPEPIEITDFVMSVVKFNLSGSNVEVNFDIDRDLPLVIADKGYLAQILSNVVINAKQSMPHGGLLDVKVKNVTKARCTFCGDIDGKFVLISIKDDGYGIPAEVMEKIFEPYFTTKEKGTGLGLATTLHLLKKHGGHINIESVPKKGTTVSLFLPTDEGNSRTINTERILEDTSAGTGHILLMDDEKMVREVTAEMIKDLGFEVELACDGQEALDKYVKAYNSGQPFDAVILDLTIPGGMGGIETIEKILTVDKDAKVIVASGYAEGSIMSDYKQYGFKKRLTKPFKIADLKKAIFELLNQNSR